MVYFIGTTKEVSKLEGHLPRCLVDEVCRGVVVLDAEMGEDRDYFTEGGYSLIVQTAEDLQLVKERFDPTQNLCEWATRISDTGYVSALYILNNEFTLLLYLPLELAQSIQDIMDNLED